MLANTSASLAQTIGDNQYNQIDADGNITRRSRGEVADSLGTDKEIPKGYRVWTVDNRFGDIKKALPDTVSYLFENTIFTTGLRGEYNTTGNLGAPRINRVFADRQEDEQFLFTQPYDFFIKKPESFHFTNTLSPITNLTYNSAGNRTNGENHLTAKFAVNAGKKIGIGFNFDYLYGRGYYQNQSTSHFNYTMYGSYLGERYQAHLLLSTNHQKVTENGGITDDYYITHPESFDDNFQTSEIPTVLEYNWNRNDNQHAFLTHRYSLGFRRRVPMTQEEIEARKFAIESMRQSDARKLSGDAKDPSAVSRDAEEKTYSGRPEGAKVMGSEPSDTTKTTGERIAVNGRNEADSLIVQDAKPTQDDQWTKDEYVPVTSFIHTMSLDNYRRIYQAYSSPTDYYADTYYQGLRNGNDSIYDKTTLFRLQNTFAISLLEGFNKWAKAGLKGFVHSDLRRFALPDEELAMRTYNEHSLSFGGQLAKQQGNALHYGAVLESWITGEDAGQLKFDATADVNFPLFGDTLTLIANGFFHRNNATFYQRHYHAKHLWWDNDDLEKTIHTRLEGRICYQKTHTSLRLTADNISNYTYFGQSYTIDSSHMRLGNTVNVRQADDNINVLTAAINQQLALGPLHGEACITYQKSSDEAVLPLPEWNLYANLFLRFRIAKVLACDLGADVRYFTKYNGLDYSPQLGQFTVQESAEKTEIGNYPIANAYANFQLKQARFFVMFSHANAGMGNRNYFLVPHYPLNERILRLGISWTFFN